MHLTKKEMEKRYKEVQELFNNPGFSAIDVAKKFGISRQRIYQILHMLGLETDKMQTHKLGDSKERLCSRCGSEKSQYANVCKKCYRKEMRLRHKMARICPMCGKFKSPTGAMCRKCWLKATPKVELVCANCGKKFIKLLSKVEYAKKWGIRIRFCSVRCRRMGRRRDVGKDN